MTSLFFEVFILAATFQYASAKGKIQTFVWLDSFGNCHGGAKNLALMYNDSGVERWGKTSAGYGTMIADREIHTLSKATATISRCKDPADETCELFQTWRFTSNICGMLLMKNVLWSPLFTYTPELTCPIKKGVYKIHHATPDVAKLAVIKFPTDGYYRVKIDADDEHTKRIYCMMFAGKFVRART